MGELGKKELGNQQGGTSKIYPKPPGGLSSKKEDLVEEKVTSKKGGKPRNKGTLRETSPKNKGLKKVKEKMEGNNPALCLETPKGGNLAPFLGKTIRGPFREKSRLMG